MPRAAVQDYIKESAAKHDTEVGGALHKNTYLADSNRELQKRLESVSEESLQYYKQVVSCVGVGRGIGGGAFGAIFSRSWDPYFIH